MFHVEHYTVELKKCPVTQSRLDPHRKVKDHMLSGAVFELQSNIDGSILYTSPRPHEDQLGDYYKSEDYISHTDSNQSLFDRAYRVARSFALNRKERWVKKWAPKAKSILDFGCGTGDFAAHMSKSGYRVNGAEPDADARAIALKKNPNRIRSTNEELESNDCYDIITMWHVLEHIPNFIEVLERLKAKLNQGGTLLVAVPNFKSLDAKIYGSDWAAYDVPRHLNHFSPEGIKALAKKIDVTFIRAFGMPLDSYYISLLSNRYQSNSPQLIRAIWNGFRSNWRARRKNNWSSMVYILRP